ncbi:MAG: hypothetical protein AAGH15_17595 [Myxococcota bacterium]
MLRTSEVALALALVCGGAAAAAVLVASYRETIVVRRLVGQLRDPKQREKTLALLRRRVERALRTADPFRVEDAVRFAVEPLVAVGLWDEVGWFAAQVRSWSPRPTFARWLAGVEALAELHRGDVRAAEAALERVEVRGPWLVAVDAYRLALGGDGEGALERLGTAPERVGLAVRHQRRLAKVHALAAAGRRDETRALLETMRREDPATLNPVLHPEGPASSLAAAVLAGGPGPFRAPG